MTRKLTPLLLALSAAGGVMALPAAAAAVPYYQAEATAAPSSSRFAVRDLIWKCAGTSCTAGRSTRRPGNDCAALVRVAGAVKSFAVEGRPLDAEELAKCNARAR